MGLGSGELLLWPYLSANWGLGIIWGAVLGITFQFFINMEIERYTLINGESVFVGLGRRLGRLAPVWFIGATIIPWMWPGIIASSAAIVIRMAGGSEGRWLAVAMLVAIGLILTLGPVVYRTQEVIQKWLIILGVPIVFTIALVVTRWQGWLDLGAGLAGAGEGYWLLPKDLPLLSFLGAFAYAGAGGTLNLAQSYYIKEKGYGMGKYGGKITSFITGKVEEISLEGKTFVANKTNLSRFRKWWKTINIEHGLVFWGTGALSIILLSLLAYSTVYHQGGGEGLEFLFTEARVISSRLKGAGEIFLILAATMLFSTQLSVFDACSRITAENLVIIDPEKFKIKNLTKYYYGFLWTLVILGIGVIAGGFSQPLRLVTLGAALNAVSMLVYTVLLLWLNLQERRKELRPSPIRIGALVTAIAFFSYFSLMVLRG